MARQKSCDKFMTNSFPLFSKFFYFFSRTCPGAHTAPIFYTSCNQQANFFSILMQDVVINIFMKN